MREFLARHWHRLVRSTPRDPGPLRPVHFDNPEARDRRILETGPLLQRILAENILPFWTRAAIDRDVGGYLLNHDVTGHFKGPVERACVPQFRMLWFFSRVAREDRWPEAEQLARHGFEFVSRHLGDPEHGGFVAAVSADGSRVTDGRKALYDQSFALFALSEYALATDSAEAMTLASAMVAILRERYEDRVHGGFHMEFARDWTPIVPPEPSGVRRPPKRMDETVHVLEALTAYDRLRPGDPWVREQLHRLILILTGTVFRKPWCASTEEHRQDWTPMYGPGVGTVSYGHDLETVALVAAGCGRAGIALPLVADWMRAVMDSAIRWGVDRTSGGIYHAGPLNGPPSDRRKTWWVQAEALVGALTAYRITGDERYANLYLGTLEWIRDRQVDWEGGDWHAFARRDGAPSGDKAYRWKSPYHNGRAMMQCLRLLAPGDPLAPGWLAD
jgi:mannobiose 2-epimerase